MTAKLCDAVRHIVEYDSPDDQGVTKRDHLTQARKGITAVNPPEYVGHVWVWFWELNGARSSNGFGGNPISFGEIEAWSNLVGCNPVDWEIRMLKAMDGVFLTEFNKKAK